MPEDIPKRAAEEIRDDLRAMRETALDLGRKLRSFGQQHVGISGQELEGFSEDLVEEARRMLDDVERRLDKIEKMAERNVREHPGAWLGGLLGVIGFGLVLGFLLRRGD